MSSIIKQFFSRAKVNKDKIYKNTFRISFNCNYFTENDFNNLKKFVDNVEVKKSDYLSFTLTNTEIKGNDFMEIEGSKYNIELNDVPQIREFINNYISLHYPKK